MNVEIQRWGLAPDSRETRRALEFIGIKPTDYHIENGKIILATLDGVKANVASFVAERRWQSADRKKIKQLAEKINKFCYP